MRHRAILSFVTLALGLGLEAGCFTDGDPETSGTADSRLSAPIVIGEPAIVGLDDSGNANLLLAQPASLGQTATIESLSFYVTSAAGSLTLGIYDANGPSGGPGKLMAHAAAITPTTGWNTANVTAPVSLAAGTYWLAYMPTDNNLHFRRAGSGGPYAYCPATSGTMPSSFCASPAHGSDHWSFYATLKPATGSATLIGCFADKSTRDLPTLLSSTATNTPAACIAGCQKAGYKYAGLQYSQQCFCGNTYGRYGTATNCTMACSGDRSQTCGGGWANDVYATAPTAGPIDGQCGTANGVAVNAAPTAGLCSSGTASTVSGSGPFNWSCTGANGGSAASCSAPLEAASSPSAAQVPGPSAQLFNNPYYSCVKNYYVASTGSDSNNGTSASSAWKTLQHADATAPAAGSCINVAPGTYDGIMVNHGGTTASSAGYVTYRCQTLDGCKITGNAGVNGNAGIFFNSSKGSATAAIMPNYVMFDGFEVVGLPPATQGGYGVGIVVYNGTNGPEIASHHVWILNSIVHGFGQGGIAFGASEYHYAFHNLSYDNANTQCDAQGSGLAVNIAHAVPGYTPTADDKANPNPLLGPSWTRADGQFFHIVFEYNVTRNNALTQCGTVSNAYDTDGNGIIFDTLAGGNPGGTYPNPSLAAFNVSYNNGGGGVHVFLSDHVTVANNTVYNNYIDPAIAGGTGMIDDNGGYDNTFINNLSVAKPGTIPASGCAYYVVPYNMWNSALSLGPASGSDVATNNVTYMLSPGCYGEVATFNNQTYSTAANKENANPMWVNVGGIDGGTIGTDTTQPSAVNFALQASSPAIGYGVAEPYLPAQAKDVGACHHSLTSCP